MREEAHHPQKAERGARLSVEVDLLTLFPEAVDGLLKCSILGRAQSEGLFSVRTTQVRDFAQGKHRKVDDRPYGGGPGMVMMPEPLVQALRACRKEGSHVIYLSPQGALLTAKRCEELATMSHLILLCGHYEGIDERVIESEVDEELSIGDYVLTNGALPALVVLDAVARFIPGVVGAEEGPYQDSFQEGIFDCPHYTRPVVFEGRTVPAVLQSGNHKEIDAWRKTKALEKTRKVRPDLYKIYKSKEQEEDERSMD